MRDFSSLGSERWLVAGSFAAAETDGVLLVIKLPIRDLDSSLWPRCSCFETRVSSCKLRACELEAPAWPSSAMPDFTAVGADGLVSSLRLRSPVVAERAAAASPRRPAPMESPIRDLGSPRLEVTPPLEVALGSFLDMLAGGVRVVMESPADDVMPELRRLLELLLRSLVELDTEGFRPLIELPIRDVMPGSIRPLERVFGSFFEVDTDGVRVLVEPPIRKLGCAGPALIRGLGLTALRPGLELGVVDRPASNELEEGERTPIEAGARDVAGGLEVILPPLGAGETTLGLDDTDGLEFSVPPGLLRLDRLGLLGARNEGELTLREEAPGLPPEGRLGISRGAGAAGRLTLAGGLALGAGAGAAACRPDEPALPEFESFRSALCARTGSAESAKIKMQNVRMGKIILRNPSFPILPLDT